MIDKILGGRKKVYKEPELHDIKLQNKHQTKDEGHPQEPDNNNVDEPLVKNDLNGIIFLKYDLLLKAFGQGHREW